MAGRGQRAQQARLTKEISMLANDPGPGISAWPTSDSLTTLEAQVLCMCYV